jgi:hypothetical protein
MCVLLNPIFELLLTIPTARLMYYRYRATRLHHSHDTEAQRIYSTLSRPTFRETANGVSQSMFPSQPSHEDRVHVSAYRREGDGDVSRMDRGAVNRGGADDGDPELPSYSE